METAERAAAERRLREQLEAPEPVTWRPRDEGNPQQLIGELVSTTHAPTAYGEKTIVILRDVEGQLWNVWLMHQTLEGEFQRQRPKQGELLAISYLGHVDGGQGASGYEKYRLVVDRQGVEIDWGANGNEAEPDPELPPAARSPEPFAGAVAPQPEPPDPSMLPCESCGFLNGRHHADCPNDIPF